MTRTITESELNQQLPFYDKVQQHYINIKPESPPLACIRTFGCQQNVADSERIKGMLARMGFGFTEEVEDADFILFNTCAVREHACDRVFGNVGALKHIKRRKPHVIISVCGCMVQQPHAAERLKESYPFVGLVFGTHVIHRFPELLWQALNQRKQLSVTPQEDGVIAEGIPVVRDGSFKAWLPIMYGCNNFCTYCIVPYVRGRERSRRKEEIIAEVCELVAGGYKDITLLGQNVNSYGKDMGFDYDFADLLEELAHIEGDFLLHFMTSHPKDATKKLVDVIANNDRVAKQFHLPLQSGSDSILKKMNRHYQLDRYMEIVDYMKVKIPDIVITTDIIVGFPGETEEDFEGTLDALRRVRYDMIYSFIYSPRMGTPAAEMENQIPAPVQSERFSRLLNLQNEIAYEINQKHLGETIRVLCDGPSKNNPNVLCGRTEGNKIVLFDGTTELTGQYVNIKINKCETFALIGEII